MQEFIANGRVVNIPDDAVGKTANGNVSFKFDFVCDSSLLDDQQKPIPTFFPIQVYGKQAEIMVQSLSKGSPILIKGEIVQRVYTNLSWGNVEPINTLPQLKLVALPS